MNTKYFKEFITFPDITVMLILFLPLMGYTVINGLYFGTWIAFVIGMATYAMSEYIIHRFLFHI